MKKITINLIISLFLTFCVLSFAILLGVGAGHANDKLDTLKNDISTTLETDDEIDDVEGYGIILQGISYGLGAFASALAFVFAILIGIYGFFMFLFAVIARCIFDKSGGRLLAYRILMGVEYALQAGIVVLFLNMVSSSFSLPILLISLLLIACIAYSGVNTYSERILN